uniref:Retrovirus-related Pol polyprotein n=1 Tax=Schizaphis graminum TaxID=13262 RepID=A0A2S2P9B7_SCHGA
MEQDVGDYIKNCAICQKGKSSKHIKQPMLITSTVTSTFQKICLDIVGPLPKTDEGNSYILTIQDELSRYAVAVALVTTDSSTVARAFVECFICIYGIPITILTDCGTNFLSNLFKDVCKLLKIEKTNTTPWHPQSNGYLERSHKTLKAYLRSFVDKDTNWDTLINYAMFCYNTTVHTSTKFTPYELVFGKKPIIPSSFLQSPEPQYNYDDYALDLKRIMQETHKTARENLIEKKNQNKQYYDQTSNPLELHVGDKVLMKEQSKKNTLDLNWTGPYEILLIHDNETITIKRGRRDYRIHINNVKKLFETDL